MSNLTTANGTVKNGATTRRRKKDAELGQDPIQELSLSDIRPSPENDQLYKPIDASDPAIQALADSIRERGLLEPLVVTSDRWILSGHRRYAAAMLAGLSTVPCRVLGISKEEDRDGFMRLLRAYNMQRVKGFDETLREEVVSASPEEVYQSLIEHRRKKANTDLADLNTIEIRAEKVRAAISSAKKPFVQAVKAVIEERRDYWPLSDRQIHYALLNDPPLRHASKPHSTYGNNLESYKSLVDLLTRGRLTDIFPWDAIADETRPFTNWATWPNVQPFINSELESLLQGYWRNLMQSQPNHIEILVEKNTVRKIVEDIAMKYCIPVTSGRGFASLPPRYEMARRFRRSGKDNLVLLIVSDFDPDGEEIAHSFARSMRDDFGIHCLHPMKVALSAEQVEEFDLQPDMLAKETSTNFARFQEQHGDYAYELEAIPPEDLQQICEDAIDEVIDRDAFNAELDREKQDAMELEKTRRRVLAKLRGAE